MHGDGSGQSHPVESKTRRLNGYVGEAACQFRDGVLRVCGPLDRTQWASFEEACGQLVEGRGCPNVEFDLTCCKYLSSLFIGCLVGTYMKILKQGRSIRMRVSPEVARFLDLAHLDEVMDYEVVNVPLPQAGNG